MTPQRTGRVSSRSVLAGLQHVYARAARIQVGLLPLLQSPPAPRVSTTTLDPFRVRTGHSEYSDKGRLPAQHRSSVSPRRSGRFSFWCSVVSVQDHAGIGDYIFDPSVDARLHFSDFIGKFLYQLWIATWLPRRDQLLPFDPSVG